MRLGRHDRIAGLATATKNEWFKTNEQTPHGFLRQMKTCHKLGNMLEEIFVYATRFSGSGDCILATSSFRHSSSNNNNANPMICFKIIIPT